MNENNKKKVPRIIDTDTQGIFENLVGRNKLHPSYATPLPLNERTLKKMQAYPQGRPVEFVKANEIRPDSWLNEERFESFRKAWGYAATQTRAIPAMAAITPEQAHSLYEALKRGEKMHEKAD